eukprot:701269-Amphidinium_carterae.1
MQLVPVPVTIDGAISVISGLGALLRWFDFTFPGGACARVSCPSSGSFVKDFGCSLGPWGASVPQWGSWVGFFGCVAWIDIGLFCMVVLFAFSSLLPFGVTVVLGSASLRYCTLVSAQCKGFHLL